MSFFNPDIPARLPLRTDQILGVSLQLHQNEAAQALHLATFLTIPPTATLYTLAGVFPDGALAQQISPSDRWRIKSRVPILSASFLINFGDRTDVDLDHCSYERR